MDRFISKNAITASWWNEIALDEAVYIVVEFGHSNISLST
jgi:hypothetical protein